MTLGILFKKPKLSLEHESDYEEKKKTIDNYKRVSSALLKKDSTWIRRLDMATFAAISNKQLHD